MLPGKIKSISQGYTSWPARRKEVVIKMETEFTMDLKLAPKYRLRSTGEVIPVVKGMRLEFIDDNFETSFAQIKYPELGKLYTVRSVRGNKVLLMEIANELIFGAPYGTFEPGFDFTRFIPARS